MSTGQSNPSLSDFRKKTDRQLSILLRGEIAKSLELARNNCVLEAEAGYDRARILITHLPDRERDGLETRLEELRLALVCRMFRSSAA